MIKHCEDCRYFLAKGATLPYNACTCHFEDMSPNDDICEDFKPNKKYIAKKLEQL
jgi:hypothetical protein